MSGRKGTPLVPRHLTVRIFVVTGEEASDSKAGSSGFLDDSEDPRLRRGLPDFDLAMDAYLVGFDQVSPSSTTVAPAYSAYTAQPCRIACVRPMSRLSKAICRVDNPLDSPPSAQGC